jgi:tetraacyldisaccharide 4'-kinase
MAASPIARGLSVLYAAAARRRRERYAARPELRGRLRRPVVSVGNLAVGGRGKTPLVATVARLLAGAGESPAILSRGYGRRHPGAGPIVVSDRDGIRADLDRSGDEPLMLARQLPGVSVVVAADRYAAGQLAETTLGATVHILDDGFQHLQLERDLDLVIVGREDIARPDTLPAGRLREPLDTLVAADAVLTADDEVVVELEGVDAPVFRLRRQDAGGAATPAPVIAVAGIAVPERFFGDLRQAGWQIAGQMVFRDHHRYSSQDLSRMVACVERHRARGIVTTEKDFVRLLPFRPFPVPVWTVPYVLTPEPLAAFREWLLSGLATVRGEARG